MSEKKENVPELAGLSKRSNPDTGDEYYVPDYVMRDFGEPEDAMSPSNGASGRRQSADFLL